MEVNIGISLIAASKLRKCGDRSKQQLPIARIIYLLTKHGG